MPEDTVLITGRFTDIVGNRAEDILFDRTFYLMGEPLNPVLISRIEFEGPSKDKVVHHSGYCFLSSHLKIDIINVLDPLSLYYSGSRRTSSWTHGLFVDGQVLYTVESEDLVRIYDVRIPDRPVQLSLTRLWGSTTDVEVYNDYAFISATLTGLHVIDVNNKEVPKVKTRLALTCNGENICRHRETVFVSGGTALSIVDISDPENPQILSELLELEGDVVESIYHEGNLFLATNDAGVLRVDVSNPDNPEYLGEYSHLEHASGFELQVPYLFVSRRNTLSVVNVTNVDDLPVVTEIPDMDLKGGLDIHNNFLYAVERGGLAVLELIRTGE